MKRVFAYIRYALFLALMVLLYFYNNHPAILLCLILSVLVPIVSIVLFLMTYRRFSFGVSLKQGISARADDNAVILHAQNQSFLPQPKAYLRYILSNELNPNDIEHVVELYVGPKETLDYPIPVRLMNCGYFKIKLLEVKVWDLMGFVSRNLPADSESDTVVLPVEINLGDPLQDFGGGSSEDEVFEKNAKGNDPSEIFEIRDYRDGDRPQQIHWKLSAKQQSIMVKEFSDITGETFDIYLCHDFGDSKQLDAYFDVMYSVGILLCRNGIAFSYCLLNESGTDVVKYHINDIEHVRDCVISMYYEKPKPRGSSLILTYLDGKDSAKQVLLLTSQPFARKEEATQLYNHNNLARLYSL